MGLSINNMPLVSVVIPCLNAEQHLIKAVESVLTQTYENWELIIIDDGSEDSTYKIAHSFVKQYPHRISVLYHQGHANLGVSASRNLGILESKGKYLTFLDADDFWAKDKLEKQVCAFEKTPDVTLCWCYSLWVEEDGKTPVFGSEGTMTISGRWGAEGVCNVYHRLLQGAFIASGSVMFRKSHLNLDDLFPTNLSQGEDYVFQLKVARNALAYCIPEVLAYYRCYLGSVSYGLTSEMLRDILYDAYRTFMVNVNNLNTIERSRLVRLAIEYIVLDKRAIKTRMSKLRKMAIDFHRHKLVNVFDLVSCCYYLLVQVLKHRI